MIGLFVLNYSSLNCDFQMISVSDMIVSNCDFQMIPVSDMIVLNYHLYDLRELLNVLD